MDQKRKCQKILRDTTIQLPELLISSLQRVKSISIDQDENRMCQISGGIEKNKRTKEIEHFLKESYEKNPRMRKGINRSKTVVSNLNTYQLKEDKKDLCSEIIENLKKRAKINSKKLEISNLIDNIEDGNLKNKKRRNYSPHSNLYNVLKNVVKWRKICDELAIVLQDKQLAKEQSAHKLGIKKKTLDDFLMFFRKGIVYQYPFKEQMNKPFGRLRKFVKEQRKKDRKKWTKKAGDVENLLASLNQAET